ncbi:serine acetyltransferase [Nocardioides sp. SLBN-35]|uniref:serine acetyltransferase n=1 Tax=Nocardioides sp. SLBN-35 TaxID=2768445 RepID=UPI00116A58AB|nr:serine acetyltransferase [Nocardioides sp. SLBN-35]TQK71267.1 serine O-acetyltransferase/putative colanic acid biosynthesis acetyltransferase WcaB [Nocardioides sp. SLBN-35]
MTWATRERKSPAVGITATGRAHQLTVSMPPTNLRADLLQDWRANRPDLRGRLVMVAFRLAHHASRNRYGARRVPATAYGLVYRVVVEWVLGIEIPWKTSIGPGARLRHGVGLVINDRSVIGARVLLRHGVTIGNAVAAGPCPVIGDDVEIGAGAVVIGGITVGDGARIGANAVVTKDVPAGGVAVGNPMRLR